jgi:hypothetical protein
MLQLFLSGRVTRLGENSPNGWLFALGSYMKIPEVAHIFGLFVQMLSLSINFDKKGPGYILGEFFTN